ncbi:DUF871 domain-containing protein [Sporolactobacillus kofuensis]|uniref:DUF871 domain-containing protein n=1 Tax=Sporolactobacillus kofuensis TaxID=269672 RepID=A0ABW1WIE6_9BACL|nr:MupG family TIM beta-alpha barrel fold protein [Sporolactobacillus kofuensis]MCO7176868.1 MupG family TIM beta-alpha barrel fold protein [Sporolactobacillus kofuensis]
MLGFSIYLNQSINKQQKRIENYQAHGFDMIFTSLHIPEEDAGVYQQRLYDLGALAKAFKLDVIVDIDAHSLNDFHLSLNEVNHITQFGITALRLDDGFDEETTAALSNQMPIVLNASTLTAESLKKMADKGLNTNKVTACHNFYPRPETGLSREAFQKSNQLFKKSGLSVAAFFPGDQDLRGPIYKGLPTLEDHRQCSPFTAFLDLCQEDVDLVILGDPGISNRALHQISEWKEEGSVLLHAHPLISDAAILQAASVVQSNRPDEARDCIRSQESRQKQLIKPPVFSHNAGPRPIGSVTVDNQLYGRYQGEIQITKRQLPLDPKVTVIGKIIDEDLPLLSFIHGRTKFQIEWIK